MKSVGMNRQLGTKWFTFYTKIRPWFACVAVLSSVGDFLQYTDVYFSYWWLMLSLLISITQPILCVVVFIKSSGNYADFVRFVKKVLLFEVIAAAYQNGVNQYANSKFDLVAGVVAFIITFLIYIFFWYVLNVKYFKKRILWESVDGNAVYTTECSDCGYLDTTAFKFCPKCGQYNFHQAKPTIEENEISFCRKCGAKLIQNDRFCRKCGSKIISDNTMYGSEKNDEIFCKNCGADITNDNEICHICQQKIS